MSLLGFGLECLSFVGKPSGLDLGLEHLGHFHVLFGFGLDLERMSVLVADLLFLDLTSWSVFFNLLVLFPNILVLIFLPCPGSGAVIRPDLFVDSSDI